MIYLLYFVLGKLGGGYFVFEVTIRKICLVGFISFAWRMTSKAIDKAIEPVYQELNTELPPASKLSPLLIITWKFWLKASQTCRCKISLTHNHSGQNQILWNRKIKQQQQKTDCDCTKKGNVMYAVMNVYHLAFILSYHLSPSHSGVQDLLQTLHTIMSNSFSFSSLSFLNFWVNTNSQ